MGNHTKRSPEFQRALKPIIDLLRNNDRTDLKRSLMISIPEREMIADWLENNTTDSPCVVKAKDDEPIFVLRGQDRLSSGLVLAWAQLRDDIQAEVQRLPAVAYEGSDHSVDAMECSEQMARYHTRKFPD